MFYRFLKNMYQMGRIDEDFLSGQVEMGRITKEEKETIIAGK